MKVWKDSILESGRVSSGARRWACGVRAAARGAQRRQAAAGGGFIVRRLVAFCF